jgi:hypothetical protein
MIKSLEIKSSKVFSIFRDELYYSHDGNYIFFLAVGELGLIDKIIILNATNLTLPE